MEMTQDEIELLLSNSSSSDGVETPDRIPGDDTDQEDTVAIEVATETSEMPEVDVDLDAPSDQIDPLPSEQDASDEASSEVSDAPEVEVVTSGDSSDEPDAEADQADEEASQEEAAEPVQRVRTPVLVKAFLVLNTVTAVAGVGLALVTYNHVVTNHQTAEDHFNVLSQRCGYNRASVDWLSGNELDTTHPLWNEVTQQVHLDRELLLQVPTRCGIINIQRPRPESINDRSTLELTIINPTMVTLCRGKVFVRSSANAHKHALDYDYELLRKWRQTLREQSFEIPDLPPGGIHRLTVSVKESDETDPKYCDLRVTFDYFKPQI